MFLKVIVLIFSWHIPRFAASHSPCPVYITLSPISQSAPESLLVINWGPGCTNPPDQIGLFNVNPAISDEKPLVLVASNHTGGAAIETNVKLGDLFNNVAYHKLIGKVPLQKNTSTTSNACSSFYLASYIRDDIQAMNCFKFSTQWMTETTAIQNVPLREIFIPGTHCSGCYATKSNRRNNVLAKIGFTQNFDVAMQLLLGIRYLDFSLGFHTSFAGVDQFWIMNDSLFIQKLGPVLQTIRRFVEIFEETVILDFRSFPSGFYNHNDRHVELLQMITKHLGSTIVEKVQDDDVEPTIAEMKKRKQFVMVFYNVETIHNDSLLVWKPWKRYSIEYLQVNEISEYMHNLFSIKSSLRSLNAGWIFHGIRSIESSYEPNKNLLSSRERAESINNQLNRLVGGPWGLNANVVALDFFMSTNLVDIALHINTFKHLGSHGKMTLVEM